MKDWIIKNKWKIIGVVIILIGIGVTFLFFKDTIIQAVSALLTCIFGAVLFSNDTKKIDDVKKEEKKDKAEFDNKIADIQEHNYTDDEIIKKSRDIK